MNYTLRFINWTKQNSLRKVILITWGVSLIFSFLLLVIGVGGGGAITEMYAVEFGTTIYFLICTLHSIPNIEEIKHTSLIAIAGFIVFFLSVFIVSSDNELFNYMLTYSGPDSNPILSFAVALWFILQNTLGKITLILGSVLHILAGIRGFMECKERYRYIFIIFIIGTSLYLLMILLLLGGNLNTWTSDSIYNLLLFWMLSPAIVFLAAIIKEGKSSLEPTIMKKLSEQPHAISHIEDQVSQTAQTCPTISSQPEAINDVPNLLPSSIPSPTKINKKKMTYIIVFFTITMIFGIIIVGIVRSKKTSIDTPLHSVTDISQNSHDNYYSNTYSDDYNDCSDNYDNYCGDSNNTFNDAPSYASPEFINRWIEQTYGNDRYLSSAFQSSYLEYIEALNKAGLSRPEIDYWWGVPENSNRIHVVSIDNISNESGQYEATISIEVNSLPVTVSLIYQAGSWYYTNFVHRYFDVDYLWMMISEQ